MTTPKAIFYGLIAIALAILFRPQIQPLFIETAHADVAGMDSYDLRYDYDFKNAVKSIVEDCDVSGHVDGEYLYSTDISC